MRELRDHLRDAEIGYSRLDIDDIGDIEQRLRRDKHTFLTMAKIVSEIDAIQEKVKLHLV